jgi:hypothetical protein
VWTNEHHKNSNLREKIMKILILPALMITLIIFTFCKQVSNQSAQNKINWTPSTINGIAIGKSKYKDLIKLWGKPDFENEFNGDPVEPEPGERLPESDIELAYKNKTVNGLTANIGIIIGEKTRLVKVISLYFEEMTKEKVTKKYGDDYYLVPATGSTCINKDQKKLPQVGSLDYPVSIVYPKIGMFIVVREDKTVVSVNYTSKCS